MLIKLYSEDVVVLSKLFCIQAIKRANDKYANTMHLENANWKVLSDNLTNIFSDDGFELVFLNSGNRRASAANIDISRLPSGVGVNMFVQPIRETVKRVIGYTPTYKTVKEYLFATMRHSGKYPGAGEGICHIPVSSGYYTVIEVLEMMDNIDTSINTKGFSLLANEFYKVHTPLGLENLIKLTNSELIGNANTITPAIASIVLVDGKSYISVLGGYSAIKVKSLGGISE